MKLNIPELTEATEEVRRFRQSGTAIVLVVDARLVAALESLAFGLGLLAGAVAALALLSEGSGVATKKGGRRGN